MHAFKPHQPQLEKLALEWGTKNVIIRCELACFDVAGEEITLAEWTKRTSAAAAAGADRGGDADGAETGAGGGAGAGERALVFWRRHTGVGGSVKAKRSLTELRRIKVGTNATALFPVVAPASPATSVSLVTFNKYART